MSNRFELMRGEVHALVRENGAGMSTLITIVAGIYYRKDSGEIRNDGAGVDFARRSTPVSASFMTNQLMNHRTAQNIFTGREPKHARSFAWRG